MRRLATLHLGFALVLLACAGNKGGGAPGTGGASATGGAVVTGGAKGRGGASASGGVVGTGGMQGTGGTSASGGSTAAGGTQGSGGATGTGGLTGTTAGDASPDVSIGNDGGASTDTAPVADTASGADGGSGPCPAGWNLAWSDDFDGVSGATADSNKWVYETGNGSGGWGNSELEYYRSQNGVLDGSGNLVITAKQETVSGFNYTSARLKTQGKSTWTYGHVESRIKIPYGQGVWPAFWLLGDDINTNSWPACGEIDVMENIGKEPTKVHGTVHGPGYSGGAGPTATYTLPGSGKLADDFHVFAIEWETNVIRWYIDGTLYSTKTPADIGSGNTWVFDKPFFILLNFAVGGGWPGNPDSTTTLPQTMTVDYVRVCQR
jgi:beta-glucanase (GH16 family)